MGDDADIPITKSILDDVVDKLVRMIGDNGKEAKTDAQQLRQELGTLSTSIKNVQTQLLDKAGRFDTDACSSSNKPPAAAGHKLRYPKYDGSDDPLTWLHKGEQFFSVLLPRRRGRPVVLPLGEERGVPSWDKFVEGVNRQFRPPMRSSPLDELIQLRRIDTVDEYQEQFLTLLARCENVTEAQQIAVFTAGLQQPPSTDVELQKPATLEEAMGLARAYERRQAALPEATSGLRTAPRSVARPPSPALKSTPPPSIAGSTSATPAAPVKPPAPDGRFKRLSPEEMARRRLEGLCFNCSKKFSKEHAKSCTGKGIFYLDLGDNPADDSLAGEDIFISTMPSRASDRVQLCNSTPPSRAPRRLPWSILGQPIPSSQNPWYAASASHPSRAQV
jgi:hypothetical protein